MLLLLIAGLAACSSNEQNKKDNAAQQEETTKGPEYNSAYICPMHCEGSGSDKPGTCPTCGMNYKKNENAE